MEESTNNRSLGLWSGGRSIPVIKQMFGKKQMIARMRPFNENAFTVTFNISGLEEASKPLRNACGW
jgi:type VI secretion system protein VasI